MEDIYDKCIDKSIINNTDDEFNIELKNYKVYDQKGSMTCWIFAAMNLIKREVANNLHIDENNLDFSVNYISFYDRFEKLNMLYDEIINNSHEIKNIKYLLFDYINSCGNFSAFKYIVNKYGIVLEHQMPMNANNFIPNDVNVMIEEKVINDIEILLNAKKINNIEELNEMKNKFLKEDYDILTNIFGIPPKVIDTETLGIDSMTALEFKDKYIKNILEQYINIISFNTLDYEKEYEMKFNVPNLEYTKYLNLEINKIKSAIIKSLKNNYPVWFGCSYRFMSCSIKNKDGILDSSLYKFEKIGIKKLPKNIAEKYDFHNYDHAMIFTGVDVNQNIPIKWKALNTFGEENNRNGYFIMNDNFFNDNVFLFAINKKFL